MKKFLFVVLVLLAFCMNVIAQDEMYCSDENISKKPVVENGTNSDNSILYIDIPQDLKIKDKIFIKNNSNTTIIQAVVALINEDGTNEVLGVSAYQYPKETVEIASYDNNELKQIKGHKIAIKVKGSTKIIGRKKVNPNEEGTESETVDNNSIDNSKITYDYTASVYEADHDLYIDVKFLGKSGNVFDF